MRYSTSSVLGLYTVWKKAAFAKTPSLSPHCVAASSSHVAGEKVINFPVSRSA